MFELFQMMKVDEKKRSALRLTREEKLMLKNGGPLEIPKRKEIEKYNRKSILK